MALGATYSYSSNMSLVERTQQDMGVNPARLALERGDLTTPDLYALLALASARFVTRWQFEYLCFPLDAQGNPASSRRVTTRLERLQRYGLARRVEWVSQVDPPVKHSAYTITLSAAFLLKDWQGKRIDWEPGMGKRQLKPMLRQLAANEFRAQVLKERRDLLTDWRMLRDAEGPVASFRINSHRYLIDCPRDDEDVCMIRPERYTRHIGTNDAEHAPFLVIVVPDDRVRVEVFERLRGDIEPHRILVTSDDRAFERSVKDPGYLWAWDPGELVERSLLPWNELCALHLPTAATVAPSWASVASPAPSLEAANTLPLPRRLEPSNR